MSRCIKTERFSRRPRGPTSREDTSAILPLGDGSARRDCRPFFPSRQEGYRGLIHRVFGETPFWFG
jgi:hypothetical protein